MITYNQEKFIAQALESVLEQTAHFEYEIVIGEDCSSDSTRDILLSYKEKYPSIILLKLNQANIGANRNFVQTLRDCRGTYIAILEGDDYWTDPLKLQKQVDFLDKRTDCAICFHNVESVDEHGIPIKAHRVPPPPKATSTISDILRNGNFIHTPSVMFRSGLISNFPDWFYSSKLGDWPLHILNAQYGDIGHLNETMAAYRVHPASMWSSASKMYRFQETIRTVEMINTHLKFKYARIINSWVSELFFEIAADQIKSGQLSNAIHNSLKGLVRSPFTIIRLAGRKLLEMKVSLKD